jgi:ribulose-phosphate 3-epimerase
MEERNNDVYLSASVLDLNPLEMHSKILEAGEYLDFIHIDVMDGIFVKNKTNAIEIYKNAKKMEKKPFDVHLMVEDPLQVIDNFDGAKIITFHIETIINDKTMTIDMEKFYEISNAINNMGAMVGVAIKPNTTESLLRAIMNKVDLILVMTVEPGYGAQKLIPYTISKVENVRKMGFKGLLEVDGGINLENAEILRRAGANVIVSGTALFGATYVYEAAKIIKGI